MALADQDLACPDDLLRQNMIVPQVDDDINSAF